MTQRTVGVHGNKFPGERAFIPSNPASGGRCSPLRRERTQNRMFTISRIRDEATAVPGAADLPIRCGASTRKTGHDHEGGARLNGRAGQAETYPRRAVPVRPRSESERGLAARWVQAEEEPAAPTAGSQAPAGKIPGRRHNCQGRGLDDVPGGANLCCPVIDPRPVARPGR